MDVDTIKNENAPTEYKPNNWMKLDRVAHATIRMNLSKSMYYTVQSCATTHELQKMLSDTYEKMVAATKIYQIQHLYNLRMKDFDSIVAHLNLTRA